MSSQSRKGPSESGSSSYEGTDSEEEGTKSRPPAVNNQDEDEGSETDSDSEALPVSQYTTVRRAAGSDMNAAKVLASVASGVIPEAAVGKRGRDANGGRGTQIVEEPVSKKRREAAAKDERSRAAKHASPAKGDKGRKSEQAPAKATRASRAEKVKAAHGGKVENMKPQPSKKRKASPPPVNGSVKHKTEVEKSSPQKAKKTALWHPALEIALCNYLLKDKSSGGALPQTKGDPYWEKLMKQLPFEEGTTVVQVCEKVRRMRARYLVLLKRVNEGGGAKNFKSSSEEKLYMIWRGIWGTGTEAAARTVSSHQAGDEDSSDESEGATLPLEKHTSAAVEQQSKRGETTSEEEDEEEEEEEEEDLDDRKNSAKPDGKLPSEDRVVSPFVSKPLLAFTPLHKDDKSKASKKGEEVTSGDQHTGDVLAGDDGKRDTGSLAYEHMHQLRTETQTFLQEIRGKCFQLVDEVRLKSFSALTGGDRFAGLAGAGLFAFDKILESSSVLEGFTSDSGRPALLEMQKKWREHRVQELSLFSQKLQLLQEQCKLQQEELRLQNEKVA